MVTCGCFILRNPYLALTWVSAMSSPDERLPLMKDPGFPASCDDLLLKWHPQTNGKSNNKHPSYPGENCPTLMLEPWPWTDPGCCSSDFFGGILVSFRKRAP